MTMGDSKEASSPTNLPPAYTPPSSQQQPNADRKQPVVLSYEAPDTEWNEHIHPGTSTAAALPPSRQQSISNDTTSAPSGSWNQNANYATIPSPAPSHQQRSSYAPSTTSAGWNQNPNYATMPSPVPLHQQQPSYTPSMASAGWNQNPDYATMPSPVPSHQQQPSYAPSMASGGWNQNQYYNAAPPSEPRPVYYQQPSYATNYSDPQTYVSEEPSTMTLDQGKVENVTHDAEGGGSNWRKWTPERTKLLLAWFAFFSLGSVALTLTALFGCYSNATSQLYLVRMEPYTILNTTKQALLDDASVAHHNASNITSVPNHQFFVSPLPWRYEVGIAGICRVYNNSALTDPSFTFTTTCTKKLHPPLDLLGLIEQDVPDGASSDQYKDWERLLTQAYPDVQSSSQMGLRSRLVVASSALTILSVIWSLSLVVATILFKPLYPKWSIFLDVIDALMMIGASAMWSVVLSQISNAYGAAGVHTGPGFWVFWAIGFAKLVVTPMMMIAQITAIVTAVIIALSCVAACGSAAAQSAANAPRTETVYVPVDNSGFTF